MGLYSMPLKHYLFRNVVATSYQFNEVDNKNTGFIPE
jgi:hypothetical protein